MSYAFRPLAENPDQQSMSGHATGWGQPQDAAADSPSLWSSTQAEPPPDSESSFSDAQSCAAEVADARQNLFGHLADPDSCAAVAHQGAQGAAQAMPHLETLQRAFGGFDLSGIAAFVGGAAAQANQRLGAMAFTRGDTVGFDAQPDLYTAAHEVAHVIDQRAGNRPQSGMGQDNDHHEQRADQIAARVVSNQPIDDLLPDPAQTPQSVGAEDQAVQLRRSSRDKAAVGQTCSDSGKTLLEGDQSLYTTAANIAQGNAKLRQAGKHGSFIKLTAGAAKKHEGHGLVKVVPTWDAKGKDAGMHGKPEAENADGGPLDIWADCGRSAGAVTGAVGPGHSDRSIVYKNSGKQKTTKGRDDSGLHPSARNLPGLGANAVYFDVMQSFIKNPKNRSFLVEGVHYTRDPKTKQIAYTMPGDGIQAQAQYEALPARGKDGFDKAAGINHHANPAIGEAYTMATGYNMPGISGLGGAWNFHFAGVILKDGADNITLENYAVGDPNAVNDDWNFGLYGTVHGDGSVDKKQTFHNDHLSTGTHGSKATTLRVRTDK